MSAILETVERPVVVVPIEGEGILDSMDGEVLFRACADILADRQNRVEFRVGQKVTAILPEFWDTLLSDTLIRYVGEIEQQGAEWSLKELKDNTREDRIKISFDGIEGETSNIRHTQCSAMAHRFEGFMNPYRQFLSHTRIAREWTELKRPDKAERMTSIAQRHKAGLLAQKGLG